MDNIITRCKKKINNYKYLSKIIDWESIEIQLNKNPNLYASYRTNAPLNIIDAILRPEIPLKGFFNFKTNLRALNLALESLWKNLGFKELRNISNKISNLSNTGFWDTTIELWLAKNLIQSNQKISLDYPLTKAHKGHTPPNADLAILNSKNKPIWLIDCLCPTLVNKNCESLLLDDSDFFVPEPNEAIKCIANIIKKKFNLKFSEYIDLFPDTRFAIVISLIKSDDLSAHLNDWILTGKCPIIINPKDYIFHPKLSFAIVGRFEEVKNRICFNHIIQYKSI